MKSQMTQTQSSLFALPESSNARTCQIQGINSHSVGCTLLCVMFYMPLTLSRVPDVSAVSVVRDIAFMRTTSTSSTPPSHTSAGFWTPRPGMRSHSGAQITAPIQYIHSSGHSGIDGVPTRLCTPCRNKKMSLIDAKLKPLCCAP